MFAAAAAANLLLTLHFRVGPDALKSQLAAVEAEITLGRSDSNIAGSGDTEFVLCAANIVEVACRVHNRCEQEYSMEGVSPYAAHQSHHDVIDSCRLFLQN